MARVADLIARVRSHGANVIVDGGKLKIINSRKLPDGALEFIKRYGKQIAAFLEEEAEFEERAAIVEFDGHTPREWADQFARFLTRTKPATVDEMEWSWFLSTCGRLIDEAPIRRAA